MELVSPQQKARSANYNRPVSASGRPPAMSSAFGVPVTTTHHKRPTITKSTPTVAVKTPSTPVSSMRAPQQVHQATPLPIMPKDYHANNVAYSTVEAPKATADRSISEVFESINFTEVTKRSSSTYAKAPAPSKSEKPRANKRQVFSAAVFVAALVGMVAMGYDLFFVPHAKPTVSYVKPTQRAEVKSPQTVNKQAQLASYTVEPTSPKWLSVGKLDVSAPVASEQSSSHSTSPVSEDVLEWQSGSARQGEYSTMVIRGSAKKNGVLANLALFHEGTVVQVERGDGTRFTYAVKSVETTSVPPTDTSLGVGAVTKQPELKLVGTISPTSYVIGSLIQQ